jgi:uncharacterized membrane protein
VEAVSADSPVAAVAAGSVAAARAPAGNRMRTKEFVSKLDHDRIVQAIREEEGRTSGQISVYLQRGNLKLDPLVAAQKRFLTLGMHKTRGRNAVLIFVAPRAHKFAVVGDEAIHQKCGDTLWDYVVKKMGDHFRSERFSDAIVDAIHDIGAVLAEHFPGTGAGPNELPDGVIES